jgi:hypothetical protein
LVHEPASTAFEMKCHNDTIDLFLCSSGYRCTGNHSASSCRKKNMSNHMRVKAAGAFKENGFAVVKIDLGDKPLHQITRHVITDKTDKDFSQTVESGELQGRNPMGEQKMVACTEPRSQVCTQDYRPVCAILLDGSLKTYSNGCNACSDTAVTGYREGACEHAEET